jgi:hypothetical protein
MAKRQPGSPGPRAVRLSSGAIKDPDNPTQLDRDPTAEAPTGPFVDPRVTNSAALNYAKGMVRRHMPPKYSQPRAGGPNLPVPPLTSETIPGRTIQEMAVAGRQAEAQAVPAGMAGGIFGSNGAMPGPGLSGRQKIPLMPGDTLPDQAVEDPEFRSGPGSRVAMNQPNLAAKYGVMRGGQFISAQQLQGVPTSETRRTGKISQSTAEGLKAIADFNASRQKSESGAAAQEKQAEQDAREGPAGRHSEVEGGTPEKMTEEERREILDQLDEYDLSRVRRSLMRDMLNNDEQKDIIEKRLKPLDLANLVITNRVSQVVPIRPGEFEPEFQSYMSEEDLEIKRLITLEANSMRGVGDQYFIDKFSLMGLTIALKAINKKPLPSHTGPDGEFNEAAFWEKYDVVRKFNFHMTASLMVNWFWFDMRVRKLFVAEKVGNG